MIARSFETMILVPMLFQLGGVAVYWIYYRSLKSNRHVSSVTILFRCTDCRHVYVDDREVPTARCPRCKRINDPIDQFWHMP